MPRFPPSGPTGRRSPSSTVLSRHYDFLPPIPRHFVAFARRYHKFALVHSLSRDKCHRVSLELVTRCLLPEFNCGNDRISQVPGRPQSSVCTCSSTPARRLAPDQVTLDAPDFRATAWPLLRERQRLSRKNNLSKLNYMAFGLAVYASRCWLPEHHAKLASGRWSDATGRASHPQGHNRKFQIHVMSIILPRQASWRNTISCYSSRTFSR